MRFGVSCRGGGERSGQHGLSLIELSVTLVVLGLVTAVVVDVVPAMRRASVTAETVRNLDDAEVSLTTFAAIHGRLPCADSNGNGFENRDGELCQAVVGRLPFATLGLGAPLINADGFEFKYALYHRPGTLAGDGALGARKERYRSPVVVDGSGDDPATLGVLAFSDPGVNQRLDFCQGLRAGIDASFDERYLHVNAPGGNQHVAYVLVDPGVGNMDLLQDEFDGLNATATNLLPRFEHPGRLPGLNYDDRVIAGYFDQMWEELGCTANMATAGRALPHLQSTAALFEQLLEDYDEQLDIARASAYADQFLAGAGLASAVAAAAHTASIIPTGVSAAMNTFGALAPAPVLAGVALGMHTAAIVMASTNMGITVDNYNRIKTHYENFQHLIEHRFDPLYVTIQDAVQTGGRTVYSDE